jgi:hypothetical protein
MSLYPNALEAREVTLFDLLDTALDKGIVVQGDATISVADVDLVFLGLKLVLASVETMRSWRGNGNQEAGSREQEAACVAQPPSAVTGRDARPEPFRRAQGGLRREESRPYGPDDVRGERQAPTSIERLAAEPEKAERGLAKLVLTVVELLRRLLEEQAIRRMQRGSLSEEEIERMGGVFQQLEHKMEELKRVFGLEGEELNLDLGPLGKLM